jgi:hypothetical protein
MLAPQYDQHLRKIELGKGKSEKPLPPSTPCPLPPTGKTVNGHVFFVELVFTLFVKCLSSISFRKTDGEYRFFREN